MYAISKEELFELFERDPKFVKYVSKYVGRLNAVSVRQCPPLPELTMVEVTYFDNGEPAKKTAGRSKCRHVLSFKGWTRDEGVDLTRPDWTTNIALQDGVNFVRLIKQQHANGTISNDYYESLMIAAETFSDDSFHFGQNFNNAEGQQYYENQYCIVRIVNGNPAFITIINGEFDGCISPPKDNGWSDSYYNGNPLNSPIKSQMRWDITGAYAATNAKWTTV